jgi:hypothetical protein
MKAIINNKIYDTDKCESLFTYHRKILKKGIFYDYDVWYEAKILKTTKGTCLRYTNKSLEKCYEDINELVIITEEEVKKVLIELNEIDLYQKEFGKLEEG